MNKQSITQIPNAYAEGFSRHYPHVAVTFKKAKDAWHVLLNGEKGDRPLTEQELREATMMFAR